MTQPIGILQYGLPTPLDEYSLPYTRNCNIFGILTVTCRKRKNLQSGSRNINGMSNRGESHWFRLLKKQHRLEKPISTYVNLEDNNQ